MNRSRAIRALGNLRPKARLVNILVSKCSQAFRTRQHDRRGPVMMTHGTACLHGVRVARPIVRGARNRRGDQLGDSAHQFIGMAAALWIERVGYDSIR